MTRFVRDLLRDLREMAEGCEEQGMTYAAQVLEHAVAEIENSVEEGDEQ